MYERGIKIISEESFCIPSQLSSDLWALLMPDAKTCLQPMKEAFEPSSPNINKCGLKSFRPQELCKYPKRGFSQRQAAHSTISLVVCH